jgi:serine/threonine protein kinase
MHNTPSPNPHPDPAARRSSVVPLASAGVVTSAPRPGTTDHVATILGENPLARPAAAAFDLPAGATLDQFEVIGPLGSGGMATVFKAKDLSLGREVALKILPPALAVEPDAVARFKFEARAAAKLNHDHVARVFSFGEDRGLHYIAFEYVEGHTLRELIDRHGPIPPADAVRYMLDTAVGLQHAAEKGVVHRDVKPSNIIITPAGRAKLIDMGLARSVDPHSINGQVTQSGMTLGTFDYISPEQAIDPRRADVRSDIYSLGCTFYHALTGRTPVPDGNAARKLTAHQTEAPTDPRLINPAIPDELALVLDRMMAKLPAHRQQTAADLIADLSRAAVAMGMTNVPGETAAHPAATHHAPPHERNWVALLS